MKLKKEQFIAVGIVVVIGVLLWMWTKAKQPKAVVGRPAEDSAIVNASGDPTASYGNSYIVVPPTIPPYNPIIANLTGVPGTPYAWEYKPPPEANPFAYVPATPDNIAAMNRQFTSPGGHGGACCDSCADDCKSGVQFSDGPSCMSPTRSAQPGFDRPIAAPSIGGWTPATASDKLMTDWLWQSAGGPDTHNYDGQLTPAASPYIN